MSLKPVLLTLAERQALEVVPQEVVFRNLVDTQQLQEAYDLLKSAKNFDVNFPSEKVVMPNGIIILRCAMTILTGRILPLIHWSDSRKFYVVSYMIRRFIYSPDFNIERHTGLGNSNIILHIMENVHPETQKNKKVVDFCIKLSVFICRHKRINSLSFSPSGLSMIESLWCNFKKSEFDACSSIIFASGKYIGPYDKKLGVHSSVRDTYHSRCTQYELNRDRTAHWAALNLGLVEANASSLFALIVFMCDDHLKFKKQQNDHRQPDFVDNFQAKVRFFSIAKRLPMELQMLLCNRVYSSAEDSVLKKDTEPAFVFYGAVLHVSDDLRNLNKIGKLVKNNKGDYFSFMDQLKEIFNRRLSRKFGNGLCADRKIYLKADVTEEEMVFIRQLDTRFWHFIGSTQNSAPNHRIQRKYECFLDFLKNEGRIASEFKDL